MRRSSSLPVSPCHHHAGCPVCPRQCPAADAARAGRRPRMPRRFKRRLHRRLGDQPRLRAAGRRACRRTAMSRPSARLASISASRRNRRWPGRVCAGRALGPGDLSGNYAGAQGSATIGVGLGGNVLVAVRQFDRFAAAQRPGQVGLSVAAGLESLELRPGR